MKAIYEIRAGTSEVQMMMVVSGTENRARGLGNEDQMTAAERAAGSIVAG